MFGLVRASKVKQLEAKVTELERRLSSSPPPNTEGDFGEANPWSKIRAGLLEAAKRDPSPENLKKVEEALHYLNRIIKSERNARYYAEHKILRKRKKSRFSP